MKALVLSSGASHAAFQAGALMALDETGWSPDVVLGSSSGAINAAAWVSGLTGKEIADLWRKIKTRNVYKWRPVSDWLKIFSWNYVFDTSPLRSFLKEHLHLPSVYSSDKVLLVSGVEVETGKQRIFSSKVGKTYDFLQSYFTITPFDHESILSSSAIPGIFPWVNGVWDGAFQQTNPLKPVVQMGATEIVIIHMDVNYRATLPNGIIETASRILEISSSYRLVADIELLRRRNCLPEYRFIDVTVISPQCPLGYSKLDFNSDMKGDVINIGYKAAKSELTNIE